MNLAKVKEENAEIMTITTIDDHGGLSDDPKSPYCTLGVFPLRINMTDKPESHAVERESSPVLRRSTILIFLLGFIAAGVVSCSIISSDIWKTKYRSLGSKSSHYNPNPGTIAPIRKLPEDEEDEEQQDEPEEENADENQYDEADEDRDGYDEENVDYDDDDNNIDGNLEDDFFTDGLADDAFSYEEDNRVAMDDFYAFEIDHTPKLLPMTDRETIGYVLIVMALTIGASGGIGGGGVVVPVYLLVMGLSPRIAIPIGSVTVLGGVLSSTMLNWTRRHPLADRPIIDWDLVLVMEPMTLMGTVFGTIFHRVVSEKLLIVLLVLLLSITAHATLKKVSGLRNIERTLGWASEKTVSQLFSCRQ